MGRTEYCDPSRLDDDQDRHACCLVAGHDGECQTEHQFAAHLCRSTARRER